MGRTTGAVLHRGQYHDVVVTQREVHRFPRTEAARARLPATAALLAALAQVDLGVATPRPLAAVDPTAPVGLCRLTTTRVPGEPLEMADIGPSDRRAVSAELSRLLAALRRAGGDMRGAVPEAEPDRWIRFAGQVRQTLFPRMSAAGRARAERELATVATLPPVMRALVHGDLGGPNLLWRREGDRLELTGVVDWDGAVIGDPAVDVASLAVTYGWRVAADALGAMGGQPGPVLARALAIAGTFALQEALPAALDGDDHHLRYGLASYRD
jgi:aminoglycoside phosphotransferase (APT) family kinase protein